MEKLRRDSGIIFQPSKSYSIISLLACLIYPWIDCVYVLQREATSIDGLQHELYIGFILDPLLRFSDVWTSVYLIRRRQLRHLLITFQSSELLGDPIFTQYVLRGQQHKTWFHGGLRYRSPISRRWQWDTSSRSRPSVPPSPRQIRPGHSTWWQWTALSRRNENRPSRHFQLMSLKPPITTSIRRQIIIKNPSGSIGEDHSGKWWRIWKGATDENNEETRIMCLYIFFFLLCLVLFQ